MDFWNGRDFSGWNNTGNNNGSNNGSGGSGTKNGYGRNVNSDNDYASEEAYGRNENDFANANGYGGEYNYNGSNGFNGNRYNGSGNDNPYKNGDSKGFSANRGSYSCNGNGNCSNGTDANDAYGACFSGSGAPDKGQFENKYNEYKTKSEDELMSELMRTAGKMKADGRFSVSELEGFYAQASGFLNDEQRAKLRGLIDMLK